MYFVNNYYFIKYSDYFSGSFQNRVKICETTQRTSTYEEMQHVLKLMFPINQAGAGSHCYVFDKKSSQQKL